MVRSFGLRCEKICHRGFQQSDTKTSPLATTTSLNIEISHVANSDMILPEKRITKALISLRGCAG